MKCFFLSVRAFYGVSLFSPPTLSEAHRNNFEISKPHQMQVRMTNFHTLLRLMDRGKDVLVTDRHTQHDHITLCFPRITSQLKNTVVGTPGSFYDLYQSKLVRKLAKGRKDILKWSKEWEAYFARQKISFTKINHHHPLPLLKARRVKSCYR